MVEGVAGVRGGGRYARTRRLLVGKPEGKSHLEHLVVDVRIKERVTWNT
jgi:hypothetical protein